MAYVQRIVDTELDELFGSLPAIALDGPKAVGKTTTALQRVRSVAELDSRAAREPVAAESTIILDWKRPLLIDEWQQVSEVWDVVRRAVDRDPSGGQFLLACSATPREGSPQHSGAGRIGRIRMRPMALSERSLVTPTVSLKELLAGRGTHRQIEGQSDLRLGDYVEEIASSGFPGLRHLTGRSRRFQLDSYIRNAVEKDVPEQGLAVRRPEAMMAWLRAYASGSSTATSYTQILNAVSPGESEKPAASTTLAYREVLASLWHLDPVAAWSPGGSPMTRLGKAHKHHLADPALAVRLMGLSESALLNGEGMPISPQAGGIFGALFESLVTLCVRVKAQAAEAEVTHLRTQNGNHEIDLVVVGPDDRVLAIEVKLAATIEDRNTRHLHWLREQLGSRLVDSIITNTGPIAYRRPDGIGVVPLGLLAP